MARKRKVAAGHENLERWLLTYADLITLLLVFFIVLYSMSAVSQKKFEGLSQSLAIIFGNVGRSGVLDGGQSVMPGNMPFKERLNMQNTEERVRRLIASKGLAGKVSTHYEERGLVISIKDSVLFTSGSAELTDAARELVMGVGQIIARMDNAVRVEGHTDPDRIHNTLFFSNWELSTTRATNVLQFLINRCDIAPKRMSAAGYGEYKPRYPNDTPESKALNRRVDIVLLSSEAGRFEPPSEPEARPPQSPETGAPEIPGTLRDRESSLPPAETPAPTLE